MPVNLNELGLSEKGQQELLRRFHEADDATKARVLQKVNIPMQFQDKDPGLQPVEPVTDTLKKGLESYKEQAPTLEEGLVGSGINPKLANVASKVFAHIPDIAAGTKAVVDLAPSVAKGAVGLGKAVKAGYTTTRDALKGTGEKEVMNLAVKAKELPIKQTAKQEMALATKKAAQEGIQKAEEAAGIGMSNTPSTVIRANLKNPERVAQFADRMEQVTKNGVKGLNKASTKVLSHYRETTKAALADKALPQNVRIRLEKAQKVLNDAISPRVPAVGEAISRFKDAVKVLGDLGPQFKKEKRLLELAIQKAENLKQTQKAIRTGAKWASVGGVTGAGAAFAKKLLGGN